MPVYANLYVTYMQPVYNSYANYYASGLTYMHYSSGGLGLVKSRPLERRVLFSRVETIGNPNCLNTNCEAPEVVSGHT